MTKPTNWFLSAEDINESQQSSIKGLVEHSHNAHTIDVIVRKDGVEKRYQADWIKYLEVFT